MSDKKLLKILTTARKAIEKAIPKRCKMKHYEPGCLSCRTNILIGELIYWEDLLKWKGKK